jgi:hypothetical protein
MTEELEKQLYKADPVFFEEALKCLSGEMNEMNTCMAFGCECGDGWFEPLLKLTRKMFLINSLAKKYDLKIVCNQLKEKFGELRCYYSVVTNTTNCSITPNNPYVDLIKEMAHEAIKTAEEDCWNVCEWCGADGGYNGKNLITTSGWISRICKTCAKENYFKKQEHSDKALKISLGKRIDNLTSIYSILNPFHKCCFTYKNENYQSIMHAFYCIKDLEHKLIYDICSIGDWEFKSFDIKRIANSVFGIEITESDYELLKDIALTCITNKYNTHIRQTLIETEDLPISNVGYHHDNVLGICVCKECADKPKLDLYGKILMEIRSELKTTNND